MDPIGFISRSQSRVAVLASLSDTPKPLHNLVDDVDSPRTTVRDNLKQLVDRGLVTEDTSRQYHATTAGALVYESYRQCEREVSVIERLEPFLKHVSTDELPESVGLFQDVSLVSRSRSEPYRPLSVLAEKLGDAAHVRACMPTMLPPVRAAVFGSPRVTTQSAQLLTEVPLSEQLESHPATTVTTRQADQSLPFGLAIVEDCVTVCSFDDEMIARAVIYTDDVAVRRWATRTFQRYWGGGETHPPYSDRMSY